MQEREQQMLGRKSRARERKSERKASEREKRARE